MKTLQWKIESPIGELYLVASEKGLCEIAWSKQDVPFAPSLAGRDAVSRHLAQGARELREYFEGKRQDFEVALDATGTPFQHEVWKELVAIPYGKTCSYRDIAVKIRHAGASRAVGTANGRNPLPVIVPCHRVITSAGTLGGYAGGLSVKRWLLQREGVTPK